MGAAGRVGDRAALHRHPAASCSAGRWPRRKTMAASTQRPTLRAVLRSLASATAAMLIPWSAGLSAVHEPIPQLPDGSWDDAPRRAAMVLLMLSPCPLLGLSIFFPAVAALLRRTTGGDSL